MRRVLVSLSLLVCGTASAGPLGKVVGGLHDAAGHDSGDRSSNNSESRESSSSSGSSSASSCCYTSNNDPYYVEPRYGPMPQLVWPSIYAYLGIQAVQDSGGSVTAELRATHRDFGVGAHLSSFFEEPEMGGTLTTRLDLWGVGGVFRLWDGGATQLWAEASFAGVHTVPALDLYGGAAGLNLRHRLGGEVSVSSIARWYILEHDVRAAELKASVHLSILQIGYRIVDFNVGPPLHGPEVGVSVTF